MPARSGSKRDNFDQWISQVLIAGNEDAEPSNQVWQRIAETASRSSPATEMWPRRWGSLHLFTAKLAWLEQPDIPGGMPWTGMGIDWWGLSPGPLSFA